MVPIRYLSFLLVLLIAACSACRHQTASLPLPEQEVALPISQPLVQEGSAPPSRQQDVILGKSVGLASKKAGCYFYPGAVRAMPLPTSTEEYALINETGFHSPLNEPLSTFSIDVDVASYANTRRFLHSNQLPPKDAVRIEEFINYFTYAYKAPTGSDPVSITTDVAEAPWARTHRLVRVGLKGREVSTENLPPSNLVFLIDTSGSMTDANKLPLLQQGFKLLVDQLRSEDTVTIVTYAGSAGLVLASTPGHKKRQIKEAIERLNAGGSTAGAAGIQLAYQMAQQNFKRRGNNRVILATDGDFNVGVSSDAELVRMIEEKRKHGIFLTVLGFGQGNYKDAKMEQLADKGNGNYAYIDSLLEAKKVLVNEMSGTLFTIAKDVKIQVEFNPALVQAYRLIGYENRRLENQDFNDDKKDAGELGAGGTVTALYEIVPAGSSKKIPNIDPLKYSTPRSSDRETWSDELMTVKFRYKQPKEDVSKLVIATVQDGGQTLSESAEDFRFAAAVAGFGMLLRQSEFKGDLTYRQVARLAQSALGEDLEGYRAEFLKLVKTAQAIESTQMVKTQIDE